MPVEELFIESQSYINPTQIAVDLERILLSTREELRTKMKPEAKKRINLNELFAPVIAQIKTLGLNLSDNDSYTQSIETVNEARDLLLREII